jgi:carbamoyl-phosphate synthase large subunit
MTEPFTIMLSAAGRRVALLRILRQSAADAGFEPRILSTDVTRNSAAFHLGDISRLVPRYREPGCLDFLVEMCRELHVRLIVPTIDPELPFYAEHRQRFAEVGATVMISSSEAIAICND